MKSSVFKYYQRTIIPKNTTKFSIDFLLRKCSAIAAAKLQLLTQSISLYSIRIKNI